MFQTKLENSQAIILVHKTQNSSKIVLFDRVLGKIDIILNNKRSYNSLLRGGLIEYTRERWNGIFILHEYKLIASLNPIDIDDMLFMHFWLETSTLLLNYHQKQEDAYRLLLFLYHTESFTSIVSKKIIIARFLTTIGIYPLNHDYANHIFFHLILAPLETILKLENNRDIDIYVQGWIHTSLENQAPLLPLKTVSFLKR
jgi:hypothetical protein